MYLRTSVRMYVRLAGWLAGRYKECVFFFLKNKKKRREEKRCGVCVCFRSGLGLGKKRRRRRGVEKDLRRIYVCTYVCTRTKREGGKASEGGGRVKDGFGQLFGGLDEE